MAAAGVGTGLSDTLRAEHKNLIIDQMWRTEIKSGTSVIQQGDRGDNLYVVESGSFDVFVAAGQAQKKVATRAAGTCFGELALMYNAPRAATVTATVDSVAWVVDRFTFRRILANVSDTQIHEYESFLKKVDLLAPLSSREREKVAEALEEVSFRKGEVIAKQGDKGDCMYILRRGTVVCTIEGEEVKRYSPGEYFGERSLIKDEPRAATLTAQTEVDVLQLDRAAFSLLLGPLEDIMARRLTEYSQYSSSKKLVTEPSTSGGAGGQAAEEKMEKFDVKREQLKVCMMSTPVRCVSSPRFFFF